MKILKWFIIVVYGLLIFGNSLIIWKEEKEEKELGFVLFTNILLALPIIYILGE